MLMPYSFHFPNNSQNDLFKNANMNPLTTCPYFYDKNSEQLGIEEMYVNIIKAVHDKFIAYIIFNGLEKRLFL